MTKATNENLHKVDDFARNYIRQQWQIRELTPKVVYAFAYLMNRSNGGASITPVAHHRLWMRLMCNVDIDRLLILGTPESAKTTWTLAYAACEVAFAPDKPFAFVGSTDTVAQRRSKTIRRMVETDEWSRIFPDVQPAKGWSWSDQEWTVGINGVAGAGQKDPTFSSYGTGSNQITGIRAWRLLIDDMLTRTNTKTQHMRDENNTWLHMSALSRVEQEGGRAIAIGNVWHPDDPHARASKESGFVVVRMPVLSETEQVWATIDYPDNYLGERLGEPVGADAS